MSSGQKRVVYNTRERLLSTDHNREQAFEAADIARALARMFLPVYEDDRGVSTLDETRAAPVTALILDGLMLRPIDGSLSALVDPGTVVMSDPDASPSEDDAPWKWVHSDGIQNVGQLTLTPNPGGIRIDVVEFSRSEEVFEYDNRDQFDQGTGLFTPVPVEKVRRGTLVFRIRLGIVGSSFPGLAIGWTPIAVIRVPAVSTNWDTVTIWDVRPLLADVHRSGGLVGSMAARVTRQLVSADGFSAPENRQAGVVEGELRGWRVGGELETSSPGTQAGYLDLLNLANQTGSGMIAAPTRFWYLYLLFPYRLPNWRRYSDPGPGGRIPNAQRGIATVSVVPPRFDGKPSSAVFPSNATDLQNGTYALEEQPAICVIAGRLSASASPVPLLMVCDGTIQRPVDDDEGSEVTAGTIDNFMAEYSFAADFAFPDNARAVWVRFRATFDGNGPVFYAIPTKVTVTASNGVNYNAVTSEASSGILRIGAGESIEFRFVARVPLEQRRDVSVARAFKMQWIFGPLPVDLSVSTSFALVQAWEIGN